nr:hypothetical protein [Dictyobacter arantiisoli]
MYNLEVAQDHTYTVGDGHWIVHNACVGGGETPGGLEFTDHGAARANERGFTPEAIDNIVRQGRKIEQWVPTEKDPGILEKRFRFSDKRGNTVVTNQYIERIITVFSHPASLNDTNFIPKP